MNEPARDVQRGGRILAGSLSLASTPSGIILVLSPGSRLKSLRLYEIDPGLRRSIRSSVRITSTRRLYAVTLRRDSDPDVRGHGTDTTMTSSRL